MEPDRFLELLEQDGTRLGIAARHCEPDTPIPTCPGWTVGDPEPVLRWLWGRRPDSVVELDGEPSALAAFRDRLRIATQ